MRKFLLYLLKLVAIIFVVAFSIQFFITNELKKTPNSLYNDWDNIVNGNLNADLLIMGSSRALVSYDSRVFNDKLKLKSYNLGFSAGGYQLQQEKLNLYLQKNKKPKIIIQNIDLAHFNVNKQLPDETQFIPVLENSKVREFLKKYDSKYEFVHLIPLLRYNNNFQEFTYGLKSIFGKNKVKESYKTYSGFNPVNKKFKLDIHNFEKLDNLKVEELDYLKKMDTIITFYKSKFGSDIKIVFVWAPEHKERLKEKYFQLKKPLLDKLSFICLHNSNYYFINMMENEISYDDNNYYDTFHLNDKGANMFTFKLIEELNKQKVLKNAL